jgi:hypothetical protein
MSPALWLYAHKFVTGKSKNKAIHWQPELLHSLLLILIEQQTPPKQGGVT